MLDPDEMLLTAVDRLDDAAATLRRSDVCPDEVAELLGVIAEVQRRILGMAGGEPRRGTASRVGVVSPIH